MVRDIHVGDKVHFNFWSDKEVTIETVNEGEGLYYLTVDESLKSKSDYCISLYVSDVSKVNHLQEKQSDENRWLLSFDVDKTLARITYMPSILRYAVNMLQLLYLHRLFGKEDKEAFEYDNVTDKGVKLYVIASTLVEFLFRKADLNYINSKSIYVSDKGFDAVEKANYATLEIEHLKRDTDKMVFLPNSLNIKRELVLLDNRYTERGFVGGYKHERFLLLKDEVLGLLSMVVLGTDDDSFIWEALIEYNKNSELKTLLDVRNSKLNVLYSITIDLLTFYDFNLDHFDAINKFDYTYFSLADELVSIESHVQDVRDRFETLPDDRWLYCHSIFEPDVTSGYLDKRIKDRKLGLIDFI